jgi:hypothetical protein
LQRPLKKETAAATSVRTTANIKCNCYRITVRS